MKLSLLGRAWTELTRGPSLLCAQLLHDVSHTALSHVVDNIFDGRVVHEEDKWLFLEMTDIPDILSRYGFDPHTICNEDNFTLLEQDAPKLCADRCDYGVRDAHAFGLLSLEQGRQIINSFAAHEGEIVMTDVYSARVFAEACKHKQLHSTNSAMS